MLRYDITCYNCSHVQTYAPGPNNSCNNCGHTAGRVSASKSNSQFKMAACKSCQYTFTYDAAQSKTPPDLCAGSFCYNASVTSIDDFHSYSNEDYKDSKEYKQRVCKHEWVWTGNPNGATFCKKCDVDYNVEIHDEIMDLANPSAY